MAELFVILENCANDSFYKEYDAADKPAREPERRRAPRLVRGDLALACTRDILSQQLTSGR